jgi:hypothetical protein
MTLVYGRRSRAKNNAMHNIMIYEPDRRHYFNAMRLVDAIMAMNRQKKGYASYHPRSGKYRVKSPAFCSPVVFRVRKMA